MSLVEIKYLYAFIDNKLQRINNEKFVEISRNNDYTTQNLLEYSHHQNFYKLIGIDLSRQTNTTVPQEISFAEKSEQNDSATKFCIA